MTESNPNQISQELDKLREEIENLRADIDQSYYRIPKQEFESNTVRKITHEVSDQVNRRISIWRNWVGFGILILSFLGITSGHIFITGIREDIKKEFDDIKKELDYEMSSKIEIEMKERMRQIKERIKQEFDILTQVQKIARESQSSELEKFKNNLEETSREVDKKLDNAVNQVSSITETALRSSLKFEVDLLEKDAKARKTVGSYKDAAKELEKLIEKAENIKDRELVTNFLDKLFEWKYKSYQWDGIDKLRTKYEKEYEFLPRTWANIAIADMNLYEETYRQIHKERSLEACKKSLNALPDYGVPYAVKLILHMIDYEREHDLVMKENEKNNALEIIRKMNSGRRVITSYETYQYLKIAQGGEYLKKYIDMLFNIFPEAMKQMKARYEKRASK